MRALVLWGVFTAMLLSPFFASGQRRRATLAEQKMCAERADHFASSHTFVFSHYDSTRNICFVRLADVRHKEENSNAYNGTSLELRDAFENFSYGECFTDENNKAISCWVTQPSNGQKKGFDTTDAWNDYVNRNYLSR